MRTNNVILRLLPVLALALVATSWSETIYYPTDQPLWGLALWYLPMVVVALDLLAAIPRPGLQHVVLAGWLYGTLAEGTVVPVLYSEAPVSFLTPVLGWHMAASIMVGVVGWGAALRSPRRWVLPLVAVASGLALGGWWAIWTVDGPLTWVGVLSGIALGATGAAVGHAVLLRMPIVRPARWLVAGSWLVLGLAAGTQSIAIPWAPIVLLAAAGPPILLLRRARQAPSDDDGAPTVLPRDPAGQSVGRVLWLGLVPLVAGATYASLVGVVGEAVAADLATSLFGLQLLVGVALATWAVTRTLRSRPLARGDRGRKATGAKRR